MEYKCLKCGFEFSAPHRPPSCPYCGEIGTAKPIPTADDILDEVTPKEEPVEENDENHTTLL